MTDRDKTINDMRLRGDTVPEIVLSVDITEPSVNRVLSKVDSVNYRESQISIRDSRNSSSNAERIQSMMTTIIQALENELDRQVTDADRLKLAVRVSELSKIVGAPLLTPGGGGAPPIVEVPETQSIDVFNTGKHGHQPDQDQHKDTQFPQPTPVPPAGSEMPPPISVQEKDEDAEDSEIDEEILGVWAAIEKDVKELV